MSAFLLVEFFDYFRRGCRCRVSVAIA